MYRHVNVGWEKDNDQSWCRNGHALRTPSQLQACPLHYMNLISIWRQISLIGKKWGGDYSLTCKGPRGIWYRILNTSSNSSAFMRWYIKSAFSAGWQSCLKDSLPVSLCKWIIYSDSYSLYGSCDCNKLATPSFHVWSSHEKLTTLLYYFARAGACYIIRRRDQEPLTRDATIQTTTVES